VAGYRNVRSAALIGGAWGIGHTLTILLVGSGIIIFKWVIPPRLGLGMELAVAIMLIVLGLANLAGTVRWIRRQRSVAKETHVHAHAHSHGDYVHTHPHGHAPETHPHDDDATPLARIDQQLAGVTGYRLVRPLVVGIVHGLAGSAAVALLLLASIGNRLQAVAALALFAAATAVSMAVLSGTFARLLERGPVRARLPWVALPLGCLSLVFGLSYSVAAIR
jgi:high-affinity nickel-transport protein